MSGSQIILYDGNGRIKIQVLLENESVWLTLNQIAELFGRDKSTISKHIKNIFDLAELSPDSTVAKIATTASDGKTCWQIKKQRPSLQSSKHWKTKNMFQILTRA